MYSLWIAIHKYIAELLGIELEEEDEELGMQPPSACQTCGPINGDIIKVPTRDGGHYMLCKTCGHSPPDEPPKRCYA